MRRAHELAESMSPLTAIDRHHIDCVTLYYNAHTEIKWQTLKYCTPMELCKLLNHVDA